MTGIGKTIKVRMELTEEMLGMMPSSKTIYEEYIAAKALDQCKIDEFEQEVKDFDVDEQVAKGRTVFPRLEDGTPFLYDYQIKGMFKDSAGMLRRITGSKCSTWKSFKKEIDGVIFVSPRKIPIHTSGPMGVCERPLRASTPQGERVSLASSETVPEGSYIDVEIMMLDPKVEKMVIECLDYGKLRGIGQWRNSGKGKFEWKIIED